MDITATKKKHSFKEKIIHRLHDPLQLRLALCAVLLASWYWLAYAPMNDQIALTTSNLELDRKRLALATEVEALREGVAQFADRLPPRSDPNEFLQYILGGVRASPLKLVSLNPENPKDAGLYEVASVRIELEGKYQDVDAFFRWVENDKRLLRIDNLRADPDSRDPESLKVQLSVLGLMGVEEKPKTEAKAKPQSKEVPPGGKGSTTAPIPVSENLEPPIVKPGAKAEPPAP